MGGLASTEFQMDLTNNNRVDVAFSNVGQSFRHTQELQKAATLRLYGERWDGVQDAGVCVWERSDVFKKVQTALTIVSIWVFIPLHLCDVIHL